MHTCMDHPCPFRNNRRGPIPISLSRSVNSVGGTIKKDRAAYASESAE